MRYVSRGLAAFMIALMAALSALAEPPTPSPQAYRDGLYWLPDLPYGDHPRQRMDIYLPSVTQGAPVIAMVHGGAWRFGDKRHRAVVKHKLAHWSSKGFIFASINYRLLPDADPGVQRDDIARALAHLQTTVGQLGGDAERLILMGHSAGGHLAALLAARPDIAYAAGATPWRATIVLDSAAVDLETLMGAPHAKLYDAAFGDGPKHWQHLSPLRQLQPNASDFLLICSQRRDNACPTAQRFATAAEAAGSHAEVSPQPYTHTGINARLGQANAYTSAVDAFIQRQLSESDKR